MGYLRRYSRMQLRLRAVNPAAGKPPPRGERSHRRTKLRVLAAWKTSLPIRAASLRSPVNEASSRVLPRARLLPRLRTRIKAPPLPSLSPLPSPPRSGREAFSDRAIQLSNRYQRCFRSIRSLVRSSDWSIDKDADADGETLFSASRARILSINRLWSHPRVSPATVDNAKPWRADVYFRFPSNELEARAACGLKR